MSDTKNNIILLGFMGTGKSVVGKKLSRILKRELVDTDKLIEKKAGKSIPEIFSEDGEEHFRGLESEVAKEVSKKKNCVIIAGGGIVLREENIRVLKTNGILICLEASPEVIYERVKNDTYRPLLQVKDPLQKIRNLLEYRKKYYDRADYFIDTSELIIDEVVDEIMKYEMSKSKVQNPK